MNKSDWIDLTLACLLIAFASLFLPVVMVVVTSAYLGYALLTNIHGVGLIQPVGMVATALLVALTY